MVPLQQPQPQLPPSQPLHQQPHPVPQPQLPAQPPSQQPQFKQPQLPPQQHQPHQPHKPQQSPPQQPSGQGQPAPVVTVPVPGNAPALGYPPLTAPPEALYRTETEAVQAVKSFAFDHQYAVITKRTNKGREGKVEAIYMTCDQGQVYRSTAKERQREPSRRNGCPFSLRISYHKIDNLWHVKVRDGTHNHGPSLPGSHPSIRREEVNQKTQYIKALLDINMPPSQILKQLRHVDPSTVIQIRDIYNLRHRLYQGKSPVPAVLISDFKPSTIKKRRGRPSTDNQAPEEASTAGAVDESGLEVDQGVDSPASGVPVSQDMHNPEQLLLNSALF